MSAARWHALVLAAGRGPGDPMAKAYGVTHKCAIAVGGQPMLRRVVAALRSCPRIGAISVSIENDATGRAILGPQAGVSFIPSKDSAARSTYEAATAFPLLVTTGDHPLLSGDILDHFIGAVERTDADLAVGLARAETILGAFPEAQRTFLRFGPDRVSGCNLFALRTERARRALDFWRYVEPVRKKPWRLVLAFGPLALARVLTGRVDLESVFAIASKHLQLKAIPVLLPQAEAAVDVDKPADKALAEMILARRAAATSPPPSSAPVANPPGNPPRTR